MLKSFHIKSLFLIIIFLAFSISTTVKAQTSQDVQGVMTPEFPKAGELVSMHLQSNSVPLDQANISWSVAGKVLSKGLGATDYSYNAGKIGTITKVTATIRTGSGTVITKTFTLQPVNIDLLWQATSYTPPFYQGKALYPHQGLITFTAIPNVSATQSLTRSTGSYIYTWKKDGDVLGSFSGYGKNTFMLRGTIISRPFNVSVTVSTAQGTAIGEASVTIRPIQPQIAFYENSPLQGVLYNHALTNFEMPGKETSISAVPFYMNTGSEPASLEYKWTMNGQTISSQKDPSMLTVRNSTGATGMSTVGLQISNTLKTLQTASRSMNVSFKGDNQSGL